MRSTISPGRYLAVSLLLASSAARAAEPPLPALVHDLTGSDARARAVARQLLPRRGPQAVPSLVPLLTSDKPAVAKAAFDIIMAIANEASAPGREADRRLVTDRLIHLVKPDQPEKRRIIGLRLLERLVPPGYDVQPIAAMLQEKPLLRDKARTTLQRIGTKPARTALRAALQHAEPEFKCALLNSLGQLEDQASLETIRALTKSKDANVRAAAARALAWTGDPAYLNVIKKVIASADAQTHSDAADALLRLADAIAQKGGNWQIAVNTYLEILQTHQGVLKDAALAGLGRIGDGSCVAPVLAAIKQADVRTRLNGIDALRRMQGLDVARKTADMYPTLALETRLAILPLLGEKKVPDVLPLLQQAAQVSDPRFRLAALKALGTTGLFDALQTLAAAARNGSSDEKAAAHDAILRIAHTSRRRGKKDQAAQAYLAALDTAADKHLRARALEGIAACPQPQAFKAVMMAAAEHKDLKEPVCKALIAVAANLTAAGQRSNALEAYEKVRQLGASAETIQLLIKQMSELDPEADLASMLGMVTNWWVLGPFELGEQNKAWNTDLIGEPNVKLDAARPVGDRQLTWKHVVSKDSAGKIDLRAHLADRDYCIAYAYAEITVDKEIDAVLKVGADDSENIWVNGRKVFELFVARPLKADEDQVPVKLKAGPNAILLKIWQNNLAWEFCLRITAPDGLPIPFTQKTE